MTGSRQGNLHDRLLRLKYFYLQPFFKKSQVSRLSHRIPQIKRSKTMIQRSKTPFEVVGSNMLDCEDKRFQHLGSNILKCWMMLDPTCWNMLEPFALGFNNIASFCFVSLTFTLTRINFAGLIFAWIYFRG